MSTELHAAWRVFIGQKKTHFLIYKTHFPGSLRTPCSLACVHLAQQTNFLM